MISQIRWQQVWQILPVVVIVVVQSGAFIARSELNSRQDQIEEALENHKVACVRFDTNGYMRVFVDDDCCKTLRHKSLD